MASYQGSLEPNIRETKDMSSVPQGTCNYVHGHRLSNHTSRHLSDACHPSQNETGSMNESLLWEVKDNGASNTVMAL